MTAMKPNELTTPRICKIHAHVNKVLHQLSYSPCQKHVNV